MLFSAFPGVELINREGVLRHYEMLTNNEIFVFVIFYYNIIGLQFVFLS